MAAAHELCFDDNFVDLPGFRNPSTTQPSMVSPPTDPLYNLIDSDRYIRNLENKLKKLKGGKKEPTAKDMISSLEKSKEDHFRRLEQFKEDYVSNFVPNSVTSDSDSSYSYIQRKMHPDRVAIDPEELVELLHDIGLEKHDDVRSAKSDTAGSVDGTDINTVSTKTEVRKLEDFKAGDFKSEELRTGDAKNEDLVPGDYKNEDLKTVGSKPDELKSGHSISMHSEAESSGI